MIQEWMGQALNPEEYRWKFRDGHLLPIVTDLQPAPKELLEVIRCNCESGCSSSRDMDFRAQAVQMHRFQNWKRKKVAKASLEANYTILILAGITLWFILTVAP